MITPFGRYRWTRLPFGLKVSSEIFQRKLTGALGDLDGSFTIADDIIVAGCGSSEQEAKLDNERKLQNLYKRCIERNIMLNDDKKEVGLTEIIFHGHKITSEGEKADKTRVKAIHEMPTPTDISDVKRLCGMVHYMAKFLPDLANELEPIRQLTRKDSVWNWSEECEVAFQKIKKRLTEAPVLAYFDVNKEAVLQVDSSKNGLGAALLQDGRPVEFASRALKPSERKWAQIEKEALSMLYGLERFDQYTYGRKVIKSGNVEEKRETVGAIQILTFHKGNHLKIVHDTKLRIIDLLIEIKKMSSDPVIKRGRKAANGLGFWNLGEELQKNNNYKHLVSSFDQRNSSAPPAMPSEESSVRHVQAGKGHIMISYNWKHQKELIKIRDILKEHGYDVWMDIDNMGGSVVDAMAKAVENAHVILICMSQQYKDSGNCKAEAEYAFQLKKKIIPLKMENGYKPDGWLGFLIGARMFFDFSGKYPFEEKVKELMREIGNFYRDEDL